MLCVKKNKWNGRRKKEKGDREDMIEKGDEVRMKEEELPSVLFMKPNTISKTQHRSFSI